MDIDVKDITTKYMEELFKNGEFENLIQKSIYSTIENAIKDCFSGYGMRMKIQEELEKEFIKQFKSIGLSAYSNMFNDIITKMVNDSIKENMAKVVQEKISNLLLKKREEIKLSEIVDKYVDYVREIYEDVDAYEIKKLNDLITINIEKNEQYNWINIIFCVGELKKELFCYEMEKDNCVKMTLGKLSSGEDKYHFLSCTYENEKIDSLRLQHYLSDFEALLINLYMNDTKIILDLDNINDYYSLSLED